MLRDLHPVARNAAWFRARIPVGMKLRYYGSMARTYARIATAGERRVRYLGRDLEYDNVATPLNLQTYPDEISNIILANMRAAPRSALDVGGNIGQFALTLHFVCGGQISIDVFEPNPEIFAVLERNCAGLPGVQPFNCALSSETLETMYFERGRSATGSVIRENASESADSIEEIHIRSSASASDVTGVDRYDLVKIDVEGYEYEVLRALDGIRARYVFVELSGLGRTKRYRHSQFFATLRDVFGDFDIVYERAASRKSTTFEMLFEIAGSTTTD